MALWNNFPYVDTHELNLDYLIRKMKELEAKWEALSTKVTASATRGNEADVTVEGSLKDGLNFDFTLPAGTIATTRQAGEVRPDGSSIVIGGAGIISSQMSGIAVTQSSGLADLPAGTFTKVRLNRATQSFGDGSILQTSDDNSIRVNVDGVYLIEGSCWIVPDTPETATKAELRVLTTATDYDHAVPIAWGIVDFNQDTDGLPLNTAMHVVTLDAGDSIYLDAAISGSDGSYRYGSRETQLTVVRLAPKTWI